MRQPFQHPQVGLTLKQRQELVQTELHPEHKWELEIALSAATAMGRGATEERLLRLMAWTGARLQHTQYHSLATDPILILKQQRAWCDQQAKAFSFLAWYLLGLQGRELGLYHTDGTSGHTVCEIFFHSAYHLFDVHSSHQTVYRAEDGHILSHEELRADPSPVERECHWWLGLDGVGKVGLYKNARPPLVTDYDWETWVDTALSVQ